jgi:hypothetical protein
MQASDYLLFGFIFLVCLFMAYVLGAYFGKYRTFVDYFFALNNGDQIHFHSMILDTSQFDHNKFNAGDKVEVEGGSPTHD